MSDTFPKWTNRLPRNIIIGAILVGAGVTWGVTYYFTPKYTRVGYQPIQPVAFSHNIHVSQVGLDCRYCHSAVEKSWYSNVPATSTCINCHGPKNGNILGDDPRLQVVRDSATSGKPIPWIQIHKLPDYVYFNHSVHVNRGVSCVECHGRIDKMDEVYHAKPLSMSFCLDCHRDPAKAVRPLDKITDLGWQATSDLKQAARVQHQQGEKFVHDWKVQSLQSCSTCHR